VLFGARFSIYLQGWTWQGRSRECWPLSTMKILREGSAAANLPAVTHAVVPPGETVSRELTRARGTDKLASSKDDVEFWGHK